MKYSYFLSKQEQELRMGVTNEVHNTFESPSDPISN